MALEFITSQPGTNLNDLHPIESNISVFHSAIATFLSPSDESNSHGMRRERIRSTPSWQGNNPRHDCAFVVEDDTKPGMSGMTIVRIKLLFSFEYDGKRYPCALVEWFDRIGKDPVTGMWVVHPSLTRGRNDQSVVHLDSLLRTAHLIPVYGKEKLPLDFHFSFSLGAFEVYYVNKYIDHNANEIAF